MNWFTELFGQTEYHKTFEQELELLVARWLDRSRKGPDTMTLEQISDALLRKAEQLIEEKDANLGNSRTKD